MTRAVIEIEAEIAAFVVEERERRVRGTALRGELATAKTAEAQGDPRVGKVASRTIEAGWHREKKIERGIIEIATTGDGYSYAIGDLVVRLMLATGKPGQKVKPLNVIYGETWAIETDATVTA